ncbi:MAG: putative maltokinase, partial [Opitutaceae bacterium]
RNGVRTPMQWTPDRNGGFSRADPARLYLPPIMDPVYGYPSVNVEAQSRSSTSLLHQMRRILSIRSSHRAFGRGTIAFVYPRNRKILAYLRLYEEEVILCVANLARSSQAVELELGPYKGRIPVDLFDRSVFPPVTDRPYALTLHGHSFFWFVLLDPSKMDGGPRAAEPESPPEFVTLVIRAGWADLRGGRAAETFLKEALPKFMAAQIWFSAKPEAIRDTRIAAAAELPGAAVGAPDGWRLLLVDGELADGSVLRCFIPTGFAWGAPEGLAALLPQTIARVRRYRAEGALVDAGVQEGFAFATIRAIEQGTDLEVDGGGRICLRATPGSAPFRAPDRAHARRAESIFSNTSFVVDSRAVLKLYRRVEAGVHPEIEMMSYLNRSAPDAAVPNLLGTIEWTQPQGEPTALGLLMSYVANQGDLAAHTREHLKRSFQDSLHLSPPPAAEPADSAALQHGLYLDIAGRLGLRLAEVHRALCRPEEADPAFRPEPLTDADVAHWRQEIAAKAEDRFGRLREWARAEPAADAGTTDLVRSLLEMQPVLLSRLETLDVKRLKMMKTRCHGDLHLGQVLLKQNDVVIVNFEGPADRPLEERRRKHTPLRDVAGILRSFDYAAATAARTVAELPAVQLRDFETFCAEWRIAAEGKFLERYRETMAGCPVWPENESAASELLDMLMLDKAIGEIGYELANRPAWLGHAVKEAVDLLSGRRPNR